MDLTQALLGLVLTGTALAGLAFVFGGGLTQANANRFVAQVGELEAAARKVMFAPVPASGSLIPTLDSLGYMPLTWRNLRANAGGRNAHPLGGGYTLVRTGSGFTLTLRSIPPDWCMRLLPGMTSAYAITAAGTGRTGTVTYPETALADGALAARCAESSQPFDLVLVYGL
jgi:hypothetical protein